MESIMHERQQMKGKTRKKPGAVALLQPSSSDLRGRQSVRATFRLSERAIEVLSVVSVHLGIKQKSLFDHLIEDTEALSHIAGEIVPRGHDFKDRVQKTFVLSRRTLACLERISKAFDAPRDILVERSIQRLLPLIDQEREKHEKHKEVEKALREYLKDGRKILDRTRESLGEDDPIYEKTEEAIETLANAHRFVDDFVEKSRIIEDF